MGTCYNSLNDQSFFDRLSPYGLTWTSSAASCPDETPDETDSQMKIKKLENERLTQTLGRLFRITIVQHLSMS